MARHLYIEPIGNWRETAQLCAVIRGLLSKCKAEDFLPVRKIKKQDTGQQAWRDFIKFAKQHNAAHS